MRVLLAFLTLLPGAALAQAASSAAPQPMTAEAEIMYALACAGLVLSLGAAHWLVARR
ncbi:hypothetical protein [Rubellimicrobium rubrum]|uniref:hypothetical protein n=1 Tax=Rubellimicrobium rubrum TaxID=2585369 RepID=UPI00159BB64D|nr:hypothetical protein [Rubellimicrobium rubrum]